MGEEAVRTYLAGDIWYSLPDEFLAEGRAASMQIPKRLYPGLGLDRSFCAVVRPSS